MTWGQQECAGEARLKRERDDLQRELDDRRYEEDRRREQEHRERKERSRERQEAYLASQCEAASWSEAFSKGIPRIAQEAREEDSLIAKIKDSDAPYGPPFFTPWLNEVKRARDLYDEAMAEAEEEIRRIRAAALGKAADKLQAEFGETATVQALRDDNYNCLVDW